MQHHSTLIRCQQCRCPMLVSKIDHRGGRLVRIAESGTRYCLARTPACCSACRQNPPARQGA